MSTVPPEGTITTQRLDGVLLIGINRPAKRNGFTPRMFRELGEAYTLLDDDPQLRVGVLHALGDHFTAGLDLPTIAPLMQCLKAWWNPLIWACRATAAVPSR
jgi:enoyl-CoA hydratase